MWKASQRLDKLPGQALLRSTLVLLAKAASSKTLVPGPRPHPTLSGSMLSTHFGSWGSLRENYISVSKWATELEKANCL